MIHRVIIVYMNSTPDPENYQNGLFISIEELRQWVLSGRILKHLFRYSEAHLMTYRIDLMMRPFLISLILRLMTYGPCVIEDELGRKEKISPVYLIRLFLRLMKDGVKRKYLLRHVIHEISEYEKSINEDKDIVQVVIRSDYSPVYLRTDLCFGIKSGGSIGHIAGVINNLDGFTGKTLFLTTDVIPTVRDNIEKHYIMPDQRFLDFKEIPSLAFNNRFFASANTLLASRGISFIYQRYSLNNYAGLKLAKKYKVPFVLEYNGSEVWIHRHWGSPLKYEKLSERIEMLNLMASDLIVVVSKAMKDELIGRGIKPDKILVNPNGVDPERYHPGIDGSEIRRKHGLEEKTVIGFIGTFGRWHGAEVLAEAFGKMLNEYPEYRKTIYLMLIGDGRTMYEVKENLEKYKVSNNVVLTGRIPQDEGPVHLAACDILVSPHVPNPDGTPFFGSPTKLFEYMAMGKGIVASDLDQIGEVLEHKRTAWLVIPGDVKSLINGMKTLIDNPLLREQLGAEARREVIAKYTWKAHTERIIGKLREVVEGYKGSHV